MAYFTTARPVADGVFNRASGFGITGLFARLSVWNDRRVTRNELSRLSDRELEDIGLCRGDIEDAVARMR